MDFNQNRRSVDNERKVYSVVASITHGRPCIINKRVIMESSKKNRSRVVINISGQIFETFDTTLARFPSSLLGDQNKRWRYYCCRTNQYFFDRNRLCFESILYFYQSNGTLNCPTGISIDLFEQECYFFQLPKTLIDAMKRREGIQENNIQLLLYIPL